MNQLPQAFNKKGAESQLSRNSSNLDDLKEYLSDRQLKELKQALQNPKTVIIISGPQIPIGKTTVTDYLRQLGYNAHEEWEVHKITLQPKSSQEIF